MAFTTRSFVAHKPTDSTSYKTLKKQYLEPLQNKIKALNGKIYPNDRPLSLMIDVKSDAVRTLQMIVKQLNLYPEITQIKI
jgi:alkaline phosphatase